MRAGENAAERRNSRFAGVKVHIDHARVTRCAQDNRVDNSAVLILAWEQICSGHLSRSQRCDNCVAGG